VSVAPAERIIFSLWNADSWKTTLSENNVKWCIPKTEQAHFVDGYYVVK